MQTFEIKHRYTGQTLYSGGGAVNSEHADNPHGQEYRAAISLIEIHAQLWMPAEALTPAEASA